MVQTRTGKETVNTPNFHPHPVLAFQVSLHIIACIRHTISLHCIALHVIASHFRDPTLLFSKYLIKIRVFKTFLSKSILKPGFLINIMSFANPQDLIFWSIFSENNLDSFQTQFQLISILKWDPFRWCRFWIPSFIKNLKIFRVLVGSGLFFQSPSLIKTLLFTTFLLVFGENLSKSSVLAKILES